MKRLLNPFIWLINNFNYFVWLYWQAEIGGADRYDFSKDYKYFK